MVQPGIDTFNSPASSASASPRSSTDTALPFPVPLPRSDFLTPSFSPSTYLSTVAPFRHQTLEDLRSELRTRSQQLSRDLLDLVNAHYADFLGLGGSLHGGKERVEELRVGLLGFEREAEAVKDAVVLREREVGEMVAEKRFVRKEMEKARALLEWENRVALLESRLKLVADNESQQFFKNETADNDIDGVGGIAGSDEDEDEDDEDEDGDDDALNGGSAISITRLRRSVQDFTLLQRLAKSIGTTQPFIVAQQPRVSRIRSTLLLDVGHSMRQATTNAKLKIGIMAMYVDLDAGREAMEALRESKGC